jgi:hypothetical protein
MLASGAKAIDKRSEIVRHRRVGFEGASAVGMRQSDSARMQGLALEIAHQGSLIVAQSTGQTATAVDRIADDRMTDRLHVNANLMRSPGLQLDVKERDRVQATSDSIVSNGGPAIGPDNLAPSVHRMPTDRLIDRITGDDPPPDQGLVVTLDGTLLHGLDEEAMGLERTGHDETAARILVQAMHQTGSRQGR